MVIEGILSCEYVMCLQTLSSGEKSVLSFSFTAVEEETDAEDDEEDEESSDVTALRAAPFLTILIRN